MLNFTIKLISDAGHQAEITSISTAAQQIEVFSRLEIMAAKRMGSTLGSENDSTMTFGTDNVGM